MKEEFPEETLFDLHSMPGFDSARFTDVINYFKGEIEGKYLVLHGPEGFVHASKITWVGLFENGNPAMQVEDTLGNTVINEFDADCELIDSIYEAGDLWFNNKSKNHENSNWFWGICSQPTDQAYLKRKEE